MGETLLSKSKPTIRIKISCPNSKLKKIKVKLIRKGKIIKVFDVANSAEITYKDDYYNPSEKIYYRLDIETNWANRIISNPIFVKFI